MKKIAFVILTTVVVLFAKAQEEKFRIGFKINPNVSWLRPDTKEISSNGSVFRFGFALNVDKLFSQHYAFGTGLNISQSGGDLNYLEYTIEDNVNLILDRNRVYKLQYAEIPLTLKMRTNEIGYITYWGQFGLGLGINVRAKANDVVDYKYELAAIDSVTSSWMETDIASYEVEDEDIKDDIKIFRTSLIMAAGIEYNISGTTSILAGITFNNGFSNILVGEGVQTDEGDSPVYDSLKPVENKLKAINNSIELNIGILF